MFIKNGDHTNGNYIQVELHCLHVAPCHNAVVVTFYPVIYSSVLCSLPPPPAPLHASHSAGALPRDLASPPNDLMYEELRRLRERVYTLETENASMTLKLNHHQWAFENRLQEIEMHICGTSSVASSNDDNERNKESII